MIDRIYHCDVCNAQRGPSNHWFMVTWETDSDERDVPVIFKWNQNLDAKVHSHVCGQECAHKLLDRYLNPQETAVAA